MTGKPVDNRGGLCEYSGIGRTPVAGAAGRAIRRRVTRGGIVPVILVLSSSLHPESRSRILANACRERLIELDRSAAWFDLAESPLPPCDGALAYGDPAVRELSQQIEQADAVLIASPVYNYDVNAALKNAVELTGTSWTNRVVGLMLAAGGQGSYMSAMGLANSLMLDFRCLIVPRFIYATGDAFDGDKLADDAIRHRVDLLVRDTLRLADAIKRAGPPAEERSENR